MGSQATDLHGGCNEVLVDATYDERRSAMITHFRHMYTAQRIKWLKPAKDCIRIL